MTGAEPFTRRQQQARKELLRAAQAALEVEDARIFLRWVLERSGILAPAQNAEEEGRRRLGLEIVALLNEIDPYEFVRLMKEGADAVVLLRNLARRRGTEEQEDDVDEGLD